MHIGGEGIEKLLINTVLKIDLKKKKKTQIQNKHALIWSKFECRRQKVVFFLQGITIP